MQLSHASGSKSFGKLLASLGAVTVSVSLGMVAAPSAQAVPTACSGQTITTTGATCSVDIGETVAFSISSPYGGAGGNSTAPGGALGGQGGVGLKVSGTYTNTSGSVETITVTLGTPGSAGAPGPNGTDGSSGGASSLADSSGTFVSVSGGTYGEGAMGSTAGANGTNGALTFPGSLPSGWTTAIAITSSAVFSAPAPSGGSDSGAAPAPVIQQFGKPHAGSCEASQPAGLNWADVGTSGWGESWSEWMNNGTGGFVCTRTLVYVPAAEHWSTL